MADQFDLVIVGGGPGGYAAAFYGASAGLSVARFLKPLTYQRLTRDSTTSVAPHVSAISGFEGMDAHKATADLRLEWLSEGR